MTVHVLLFAALAERLGKRKLSLAAPEGACVSQVLAILEKQYPTLTPMRDPLATAVNLTYVHGHYTLADGDELALIPPVSGG